MWLPCTLRIYYIKWLTESSYRDEELLSLLDILGGDDTEDVTEPGVLTLHVDDVPLGAVVDQVAGGGLVVVPVLVLGRDVQHLPRLRSLHQVDGLLQTEEDLRLGSVDSIEVSHHRVVTKISGVKYILDI